MPRKRHDTTVGVLDLHGYSKQAITTGGGEESYYAPTNQELGRRRARVMPEDGKPLPPLSEGLAFVESMADDPLFE